MQLSKNTYLTTLLYGFLLLIFTVAPVKAQELAAILEVITPGVEVKRVNTENWIAVNIEAIVGVGDIIRTDNTGYARVTFFADGVDTDILPSTEFRINTFEGSTIESYNLTVEVLIGQTTQRLTRLLDSNANYNILTPAMELVARGTAFAIRVEGDGRSAMLVSEGLVAADNETEAEEVNPGFGIRADESLSDVVAATSFAELDAALDGCVANINTVDDVSLNVRLGPGTNYTRIGTIEPLTIARFYGQFSDDEDWFRIQFRDSYGWILASNVILAQSCAGLRQFDATFAGEDPESFSSLTEDFSLTESNPVQETTPEVTPEATPTT